MQEVAQTTRTAGEGAVSTDRGSSAVEVVDVANPLDWHSAGELRRRVVAAMESAPAVIVDLSRVTTMDSAGTGAIVTVAVRALERGVRLAVVADQAPVPEILTSLGLPDVIAVVATVAEARQHVGQPVSGVKIPTTTFEEIPMRECLQLLAAQHFGRLGVVVNGQPIIFPVNYSSDGPNVIIQTAAGTKLENAELRRVVFEIDGTDESSKTGWSVMVQGLGADITDARNPSAIDLRKVDVETWAPDAKPSRLTIVPITITGRRIRSL